MIAEIDRLLFRSEEITKIRKSSQDDTDDAFMDIRVYVAPYKRQISAAIGACSNILLYHKRIGIFVRVDDRLSASCCSRSATSDRLESLLSELETSNGAGLYDQERFETIDRLWLEQRLYELDGDTDRNPINLKTQLSDHLRGIYDCTGLTKPLAAVLLIGETGLIIKSWKQSHFILVLALPDQVS